jgi:hypothetical protein
VLRVQATIWNLFWTDDKERIIKFSLSCEYWALGEIVSVSMM